MDGITHWLQGRNGMKQAMDKVAEQADCQENYSLVLLERMRSPNIMDQMVRLQCNYDLAESHVASITPEHMAGIRRHIENMIDEVSRHTSISLNPGDESNALGVAPLQRGTGGARRFSTKELMIIEAHEKFHQIHPTP